MIAQRHPDPSIAPPQARAGGYRVQAPRLDFVASLGGRDEPDAIEAPALTRPPDLPADPHVFAVFENELLSASAPPGLAAAAPTLWPRFAGYYEHLARLPRRARRALQRQWRRSLGAIALLCALGQAPALAATINVNGTTCNLVDAITAANTNTATGGCSAGSGADTLVLAAGSTHTLTQVNSYAYTYNNGLPVIASGITIEGNSSTITRDSNAPAFRIFAVRFTGNLTLQDTTVSGGVGGTAAASTTKAPSP